MRKAVRNQASLGFSILVDEIDGGEEGLEKRWDVCLKQLIYGLALKYKIKK